jgi:hypothetical protein
MVQRQLSYLNCRKLDCRQVKPLIFSVSGFALAYAANMFILMNLYDPIVGLVGRSSLYSLGSDHTENTAYSRPFTLVYRLYHISVNNFKFIVTELHGIQEWGLLYNSHKYFKVFISCARLQNAQLPWPWCSIKENGDFHQSRESRMCLNFMILSQQRVFSGGLLLLMGSWLQQGRQFTSGTQIFPWN